MREPTGGDRGQISVEMLGITPLILIVLVLLWQFVLAGYTYTLAGNAADEAARAAAVGGDPAAAARQDLPSAWASGAAIRTWTQGPLVKAEVDLAVPVLIPGLVDFPFTVHGVAGAAQER
jgi:pilus assembly protein CpaE